MRILPVRVYLMIQMTVMVEAARRCLAIAQNMIAESRKVIAPHEPSERSQIRVGTHVGDLSCGVLGRNIPKFCVW